MVMSLWLLDWMGNCKVLKQDPVQKSLIISADQWEITYNIINTAALFWFKD
jgi:hypothetical protein